MIREEQKDFANGKKSSERHPTLIFRLAGHEYGVLKSDVIRLLKTANVTSLPNMPGSIIGIIEHKGHVIPVMDLRTHFGLSKRENGKQTPVLVVVLNDQETGLIVDDIMAEIVINDKNIRSGKTLLIPELADPGDSKHHMILARLATVDGRIMPILQISALLTPDEQSQLAHTIPSNTKA